MTLNRLFVILVLVGAGCGDDTTGSGRDMAVGDMAICSGGPAPGPADTHCVMGDAGVQIQVIDPNACTAPPPPPPPPDAGMMAQYGDTMWGTSGLDDDCKYAVSYTIDPICENQGVSIAVTAKKLADNLPVTCDPIHIRLEGFLTNNLSHPLPNPPPTVTSPTPGTYKISPVKFDQGGQWTIRFHFCENCTDLPQSPHGHAAFFINVP